jgi:hypothetical protein
VSIVRYSIRITASCLLLALTGLANAQSRDPAAAEALFRQGREAMEAQRYAEALPRFVESQRLEPAVGTLMNIATCEEKVGRLASAWQRWNEAIDALPATDDRLTFARNRAKALEQRLPRLAVSLASPRDQGARVFRDDVELGPASQGALLPIDPGLHTVTVQMPGHRTEKTTVHLGEGEKKQIEVHSGAAATTVPSEREEPTEAPWRRTVGWTLTGLGVAGVGVAAVSGLMRMEDRGTVETNCPDNVCINQKGLDAVASGRTLTAVNTAGWIAGGVGLGSGLYFLLSGGRSSASAPRVTPSVARDGFSFWYGGTF